MRKVTETVCTAFADGRAVTCGNTAVTVDDRDGFPIVRMYLHGNLIAERINGETRGTLAGWPTPTTRDRLNGLGRILGSGAGWYQHRHAQHVSTPYEIPGDRETTAHDWHVIHREPAALRRQAD